MYATERTPVKKPPVTKESKSSALVTTTLRLVVLLLEDRSNTNLTGTTKSSRTPLSKQLSLLKLNRGKIQPVVESTPTTSRTSPVRTRSSPKSDITPVEIFPKIQTSHRRRKNTIEPPLWNILYLKIRRLNLHH